MLNNPRRNHGMRAVLKWATNEHWKKNGRLRRHCALPSVVLVKDELQQGKHPSADRLRVTNLHLTLYERRPCPVTRRISLKSIFPSRMHIWCEESTLKDRRGKRERPSGVHTPDSSRNPATGGFGNSHGDDDCKDSQEENDAARKRVSFLARVEAREDAPFRAQIQSWPA